MNMVKRAAAETRPLVCSLPVFEPSDMPRRIARSAVAAKLDPGRLFAMALSGLVALTFVSYAVYAHEWSELSAMRHLGNPPPQDK